MLGAVIMVLLGAIITSGGLRVMFSKRRHMTLMNRVFWGYMNLVIGLAFILFGLIMLMADR